MTLSQLAKLTKTSVSTVSKAFSGSREISEETRTRIYEMAKKHNCFDKYYKAPRSRPLIALLTPEPDGEFYSREIGLMEKSLAKRGADSIIAFHRFDLERQAQLFRELAYGLKVDGIILWGVGQSIKNPDHIPLIAITASEPPQNSDVVRLELETGLAELADTLKRYGHTDVGFIGETFTIHKENVFKNAMRHAGLPFYDKYFVRTKSRFAESGEAGMRELIKRNAVPSVIVTGYDQIAYGAMRAARSAGYKIPEDISFVGIDDISTASYLDTPLTSLQIDFEAACPQILDLLFKRIENRYYRAREAITVPVKLNVRQSLRDKNN